MNNIEFSIIVPIYNVENYLDRCIESLINQSYKNIEILLVDDGSTDNCPIICDRYEKIDKRIKVFHKKNGGLSDARNFGLRESKGKYIMFVDSDDYIDTKSCEKFKKIIDDSNTNIDIIAADTQRFGKSFHLKQRYQKINNQGNLSGSEFLKVQLKNNTMYVTACRNIYRRELLIDNKLYFKLGILHEDEEWTPRVFLKADNVVYSGFIFYYYYIREGSITQTKIKTKNALDVISTCNELKALYQNIEDKELKLLLNDYLVKLYLYAFFMGRLLGPEFKNVIHEKFFQELTYSKKLNKEVKLFCLNEYIYYIVKLSAQITKRIIKIFSQKLSIKKYW